MTQPGSPLVVQSVQRGTTVGLVRIGVSERGLRSVEFDPAPGALDDDLAASSTGWVDRVVAWLADPVAPLGIPLDPRGTSFQLEVWRALQAIPPGTTATYAAVARQVGRPRAVRAVGRAVGSNRLAVVVPCHRVIRTDGGLGGFRWGLERKRLLLARESGRAVPSVRPVG